MLGIKACNFREHDRSAEKVCSPRSLLPPANVALLSLILLLKLVNSHSATRVVSFLNVLFSAHTFFNTLNRFTCNFWRISRLLYWRFQYNRLSLKAGSLCDCRCFLMLDEINQQVWCSLESLKCNRARWRTG
jgi:hypothetical protein